MTDLPTGTVTLLFTDIEGSTRLLHTLGPRYRDVLEHHRALLREAFSSHEGVEVDTQGDAFFYAFPTPQGALDAAVKAQGALSDHPWAQGIEVRVRVKPHCPRAHSTLGCASPRPRLGCETPVPCAVADRPGCLENLFPTSIQRPTFPLESGGLAVKLAVKLKGSTVTCDAQCREQRLRGWSQLDSHQRQRIMRPIPTQPLP